VGNLQEALAADEKAAAEDEEPTQVGPKHKLPAAVALRASGTMPVDSKGRPVIRKIGGSAPPSKPPPSVPPGTATFTSAPPPPTRPPPSSSRNPPGGSSPPLPLPKLPPTRPMAFEPSAAPGTTPSRPPSDPDRLLNVDAGWSSSRLPKSEPSSPDLEEETQISAGAKKPVVDPDKGGKE
jgi:hypothetical protein